MYKKTNHKKEAILGCLFLLFPVAMVSVRHWASTIFVLMALFALYMLPQIIKLRPNLQRDEKIFFGFVILYFLSFVVSGIANGWGSEQNQALNIEFRYLMVIPLYLVLRVLKFDINYLLTGFILSLILGSVLTVYEIVLLGEQKIGGIYGTLFVGPIMLLFAFLLLPEFMEKSDWKYKLFLGILIVTGTGIALLSGTRSAYLAVVIITFLLIAFYFKNKAKLYIGIPIILTIVLSYYYIPEVAHRTDKAILEFEKYTNASESELIQKKILTSVETRFEMWRSIKYFTADYPLLGIGKGNYQKQVARYVEQGLLNPEVARHGHPHNMFIYILITQGIAGFIIFLGLLYYPFWLFFKQRKKKPDLAIMGMILIISISIYGLTETAPVNKGNFSAVFIVLLVALLQTLHTNGNIREV